VKAKAGLNSWKKSEFAASHLLVEGAMHDCSTRIVSAEARIKEKGWMHFVEERTNVNANH